MTQAVRELLDDPEVPASRIWLSLLRDVSSSLIPEHVADVTRGHSIPGFASTARALRFVMVLALIAAIPLATGAGGFFLGRSQAQPDARPSAVVFDVFFFDTGSGATQWMPMRCTLISPPGVEQVFYGYANGAAVRCPDPRPVELPR